MKLTRRLFARMAPAAPALAKIATGAEMINNRALPSGHSLSLIGTAYTGSDEPVATANANKWSMFRGALKQALMPVQANLDRRAMFDGFDPDILSLRSVSTQHRAYMLARDVRKHKQAELDTKNKWRAAFGLHQESDW